MNRFLQDQADQQGLVRSFSQLPDSIDGIQIDTALGGDAHVLPLSLASEQVMIVLSGSVTSLTGSYAWIKMMSNECVRQHFLVFVNKADTAPVSRAVFDSFSRIVRQYLSVSLEFVGFTVMSEKMYQSNRLCQPLIHVFPAFQAANDFRQLADNVIYSTCTGHFN